ncbi:hypothetical protein ZWY2020_019540 [Hordeum vulgare]|nr:hypothetical protein ZWY2020_019540 [Hordeum vulgare]
MVQLAILMIYLAVLQGLHHLTQKGKDVSRHHGPITHNNIIWGAIDYPSFLTLLKQLIPPLSTQLADRRSTIVKQACHLLNVLSKELLGDFEPCAEQFIPMLFKLVVITMLVIAESSDTCIKTILQNCKVARILPRVADTTKNDRSAILRARCCEYALLILEYWADAPEIQRSADLYEDLIKCCVADAMSEHTRAKQQNLLAAMLQYPIEP